MQLQQPVPPVQVQVLQPDPKPVPEMEEVIQAQGQLIQPVVEEINHGDVLAIDADDTDSDNEFNQIPAPRPQVVQVNILVLQNPQPWIVEEVPLQELVHFDDLAPQLPADQIDNHVQLGFLDTFVPPADPAQYLGSTSKSPSAAAVRCWANHFSSVDTTKPTVTIPSEWMDFFSLMLLKPGSFEWAKDFLTSPAWTALCNLSKGTTYSFSLPNSTPSVIISDYSCSEPHIPSFGDLENEEDEVELDPRKKSPATAHDLAHASMEDGANQEDSLAGKQPMQASSTSQNLVTPPPSKGKRSKDPIISDALLRRSARLHNNSKGFKSSGCKNKSCLGCSSDPPTLSASVVRDLGASFCKLDPAGLSEEALNAKPTKTKPVSKPKAKRARKDGEGPSTKDGSAADSGEGSTASSCNK